MASASIRSNGSTATNISQPTPMPSASLLVGSGAVARLDWVERMDFTAISLVLSVVAGVFVASIDLRRYGGDDKKNDEAEKIIDAEGDMTVAIIREGTVEVANGEA